MTHRKKCSLLIMNLEHALLVLCTNVGQEGGFLSRIFTNEDMYFTVFHSCLIKFSYIHKTFKQRL